jgi:hypothetical protein
MSNPANLRQEVSVTPVNLLNQIKPSPMEAGLLVLSLPLVVLSGVFLYKKLRVVKLQRQVEMLERLWCLNSSEETQR